MAESKHDADCLRRREDASMLYVCTCAMTDEQVAESAVSKRAVLSDQIRCTDCGTTRAQDVIDCPVCDVPSGHVHGACRDAADLKVENDQLRAKLVNVALHLTYALDAIEGKPWTGWTTDDARAELSAASTTKEPRDA